MIVYLKDCNGDLERAIKRLDRKLVKDGFWEEVRRRQYYEKPSDKRRRKKAESLYRINKGKK